MRDDQVLKPTVYIDAVPALRWRRPGVRRSIARILAIVAAILLLGGGGLGLAHASGAWAHDELGACLKSW